MSAQAPPADDAPAAPLDISTGPIADKAPTTRIDVTPGGGVVGIPQAGGPGWIFQGPGPSRIGQVENVGPDLNFDGFPDDEVTGAVHVILPHPTDANIVYIGAVNGGVWKTTNATAASPTWIPLTDFMPSLSIGALEFDWTDTTYQTLVAGVGRFSSFGSEGGALTGLYKTTNGGVTWTHIGAVALQGQNISAVLARGNLIMASSTEFRFGDSVSTFDSGTFRSTDGGQTFVRLGQFPGPTTFRTGRVFDMESHPNDPMTVFAAVVNANGINGNGIYRSDDFGATWTRVSNNRMNDLMLNNVTSNVEISIFDDGVGTQVIYAAILVFGQLSNGGVFRSTNRGVTWAELPQPVTQETGGEVGTNPTFKPDAGIPGGQGAIHFSIEADPEFSSFVYVGGDRQPAGAGDCCGFPNGIGATDFSGRLFRGDVFSNLTDKWSHLTHSPNVVSKPFGGTASVSAPHADSREIAFDANGTLLEADDGGVYRRTLPRSKQGDWFSIIGNLGVTEIHDIAWDAVSNVAVSGNQDTGTTYQASTGNTTWISFRTADGGDILIDDTTSVAASTRYSSFQFLGNPRRSTWLSNNTLLSDELVSGSGFLGTPLFVTPLALNTIDRSRIVSSSREFINESFNRGTNFTPEPLFFGDNVFANFTANALAYGGRIDGATNADLLWAGGVSGAYETIDPEGGAPVPPIPAPNVIVRPNLQAGLLVTNYPGRGGGFFERQPVDIEIDPANGRICYVADQFGDILRTMDFGVTWEDVGVRLGDVGVLRQLEFVTTATSRYLLVCADLGVFFTDIDSLDVDPTVARWRELGTNLPNAPVWDIEYDAADDLVVVGTLGRGAWTFTGISDKLDAVLPRGVVYVNPNFTGTQLGTKGAPFRNISTAIDNVFIGGYIILAPGNYNASVLTVSKPVRFSVDGSGIARIQ